MRVYVQWELQIFQLFYPQYKKSTTGESYLQQSKPQSYQYQKANIIQPSRERIVSTQSGFSRHGIEGLPQQPSVYIPPVRNVKGHNNVDPRTSTTMGPKTIILLIFAMVLLLHGASSSPDGLFDLLFPGYSGGRRTYHSGGQARGGPRASGGRSYKDICKVYNADPYAVHGRSPYPAAPLCPYN